MRHLERCWDPISWPSCMRTIHASGIVVTPQAQRHFHSTVRQGRIWSLLTKLSPVPLANGNNVHGNTTFFWFIGCSWLIVFCLYLISTVGQAALFFWTFSALNKCLLVRSILHGIQLSVPEVTPERNGQGGGNHAGAYFSTSSTPCYDFIIPIITWGNCWLERP